MPNAIHEEAIEVFKQAIKLKPDYAESHYGLGVTYENLGRHEEAIEAFKQAIRLKPDHARAHNNLGETYLKIGDKGSALEEYKILKTLDPEKANKLLTAVNAGAVSEEARRHMDRGMAAMAMAKSPADLEEAIKEFQKAIELAPNWPEAYRQLALAQEKAEKYRDAAVSLKQYLWLAPDANDAETVKSLINKIEYRIEKEEKDRLNPASLVGIWTPDEENGGAFNRFEIRNNNGIVEGGLRMYAFTEERGLGRKPWFVPIQWDGKLLVISHTQYFYCDKSVQMDCCPADASLSLTMIDKDTLKGTIQKLPDKLDRNRIKGYLIDEGVWRRVK